MSPSLHDVTQAVGRCPSLPKSCFVVMVTALLLLVLPRLFYINKTYRCRRPAHCHGAGVIATKLSYFNNFIVMALGTEGGRFSLPWRGPFQ